MECSTRKPVGCGSASMRAFLEPEFFQKPHGRHRVRLVLVDPREARMCLVKLGRLGLGERGGMQRTRIRNPTTAGERSKCSPPHPYLAGLTAIPWNKLTLGCLKQNVLQTLYGETWLSRPDPRTNAAGRRPLHYPNPHTSSLKLPVSNARSMLVPLF